MDESLAADSDALDEGVRQLVLDGRDRGLSCTAIAEALASNLHLLLAETPRGRDRREALGALVDKTEFHLLSDIAAQPAVEPA